MQKETEAATFFRQMFFQVMINAVSNAASPLLPHLPPLPHLERIFLLPLHHVQYERGEHVEALAVADTLVAASVRQQHPLQKRPLLVVILATEAAAACPVKVLRGRERQGTGSGMPMLYYSGDFNSTSCRHEC